MPSQEIEMSRINYVPLNSNDNIRDFNSAGKSIGTSWVTSQIIQVNDDFKKMALDIEVQSLAGGTQLSVIVEHSLLGGASYWAPGIELDNLQVTDLVEVSYDIKQVVYNMKTLVANMARRMRFDVSNSNYFRVKTKLDAGTGVVRVLSSISD